MPGTVIRWKRISETAAAPFRDGERLPFTVCLVRIRDKDTYEAWDKRGEYPKPIKTGLKTREDAMAVVETAMKVPV